MKLVRLFFFLAFVGNAGLASGQLTPASLASAVASQTCGKISVELRQTPLPTEGMKFNGAVCFYRNGDTERAMALFQEVRGLEAEKWGLASFWLAKCHAVAGHDSLAVALLQALPPGVLQHRMLAQPEFGRLAKTNGAFIRLKASLAPGFHVWTGLLTAVAALGLVLGLLLLFGRSRFSTGEKRLSVAVLSFALQLFCYVLIWTGYVAYVPQAQNLWQFLTFLVGPSLYLYLKDSFKEAYTAREAALHYALPIGSGLLALPTLLLGQGAGSDLLAIGTSPILLTCQLLFYSMLILGATRNDWQVDSNIKAWTKVVAWGMGLYTLGYITYFVLVRCSFFDPAWDYGISLVMAAGILAVAYMGLVQKRVFSSEPIGHFLPIKKYRTSTLTEGASDSIKRQMERLLKEEQVFKENELGLADLAAYLNINRHQLSQVINEHYGVNFYEFINQYRVRHVQGLLADPHFQHYTIQQIAFEAGFNNKASFNRCFKKEIGLTPSAYRLRENSAAS